MSRTRDSRGELRQLARSEAFPNLLETSKSVTRALAGSGEIEAKGLDTAIRRILDVAFVVSLSAQIVRRALDVQSRFELGPQDAVIFASICQHLSEQGKGVKIFANKNSADFAKAIIEDHLQQYGCKLLTKLSNARQFIEHVLEKK